jgi:hypothetical protein
MELSLVLGQAKCTVQSGSTRNPARLRFAASSLHLRAIEPSIRPRRGSGPGDLKMCRNIKTLFNFEPPATEDEIQASALQFVRKLSGFNKPSQANAEAFERAVAEVSDSARRLLASLETNAPARDREIEAEKAKERSKLRFG